MNTVAKENKSVLLGTATNYSLDILGIESWWGWDFPHLSRPVLCPTQPPTQWVLRYSWRVKQLGRCIDHPPRSSAKRIQLYLYSPSGPSWPVLGWTFYYTSQRERVRDIYSEQDMENNVSVSVTKEEINIRRMSCPKILYILHVHIHFVFSYALCWTSSLIKTF